MPSEIGSPGGEDEYDVKESLVEGKGKSTRDSSAQLKWRPEGYWEESLAFLKANWVPMIANGFEWFEFATFAYLVDPISENFAHGNHVIVWFIFSIAFLCRPIGGLLIGTLGDALGRKPAFWVASITVVCSTVLQGALPSYRTGGKVSGIIGLTGLLILRITQGLGIGGELGSGIIYLAESSPRRIVGMTMACLSASSGLGFLLASFVAAALNSGLTQEEIYDWGWRIPFLLAVFPGVAILYLLDQINETPVFEQDVQTGDQERGVGAENRSRNDEAASLLSGMDRIVTLFAIMAGSAAFWYVGCVYVFDWVRDDKASDSNSRIMRDILWIAVLQNCIQLPASIFAGYLTDRFGLRVSMPAALGSALLVGLPIFVLIEVRVSLPLMILGPGILFGIISGLLGTVSNLLASDMFPPKLRHRSVGLGYNMSIMLFGGLGPAWVELAKDSIPLAAGYFLAITAFFSLSTYHFIGEGYLPKKSLRIE
mmetsp:Transcript_6462/g.8908  ORF Transcript_6462/g.8908 Transcript_6462/m.8908 type:complete len:483 (+) Transcript_6462:128-1576(+)|eukprot:CAMPEP_0184488328 /NCGR_PEP_ID=MMETSP0113_2-20130426/11280_1 /TAXON_ID=91329 /ORGANISM="Norrisiella sphaerica, Strain BC52" /LENGTH=482 /DNA_ID=CAMNT_0026870967 /DNA_START=104 /DNA_END=1552 /DNA_ORIENTATION=-